MITDKLKEESKKISSRVTAESKRLIDQRKQERKDVADMSDVIEQAEQSDAASRKTMLDQFKTAEKVEAMER